MNLAEIDYWDFSNTDYNPALDPLPESVNRGKIIIILLLFCKNYRI